MPLRLLFHRSPQRAAALGAMLAAVAIVPLPALGQYKSVGPDGRITYSDREPPASEGRVTALGARGGAQAAEPELPYELRQVAAKYPVTLYTTTNACEPCALARQLLKQRGVPFAEKQVTSPEDGDALERLSGGREAPTLTIGSQTLRGLAADSWNQYLDAAGYPRESKLPSNYAYRTGPIVERRDPNVARNDAASANRAATPTPLPAPARASSGPIRF